MTKHGSMLELCRALARKEETRMRGREDRARILSEALHARRPWLVLRKDSTLCARFIEGEWDAPSIKHVVDVAEEMHFLYERTEYPSILRDLRRSDRGMDRDFGNSRYWRKREMYRDGLIEYMDDCTPDCSDIEDEDEYEEREEENRRQIAKKNALKRWLRSHSNSSDIAAYLPVSMKTLHLCQVLLQHPTR